MRTSDMRFKIGDRAYLRIKAATRKTWLIVVEIVDSKVVYGNEHYSVQPTTIDVLGATGADCRDIWVTSERLVNL